MAREPAEFDARDPRWVERATSLLEPLARYHRLEVRGLERWPKGAALIVGNHNSGAGLTDALFLLRVFRRYGFDEPLHILAHEKLFVVPAIAKLLGSLGVLPANPTSAREALRAGKKLLVFPGSDYDSMRAYSERKRVIFAGHKGFAKIAYEENVPIVPLVTCGAHETWIVLTQGRAFADAIGLGRILRWHSMPIALSIPWGLTIGPASYLPYLPLPAKVTVELLEAMHPRELAAESEDASLAVYDAVVETMQRALERLYAERRWPILG